MTLNELYNVKLMEYKRYGVKDDPDKLLSMLLLPKKDEFEPLRVAEGAFYEAYKKEIDSMIEKVIKDFDITDEEIIWHVKKKEYYVIILKKIKFGLYFVGDLV